MTNKEKQIKLLEDARVFEYLNWKQLITIIYWSLFNSSKIKYFYEQLNLGKAARFAYIDTKNAIK